MTATYEAHITIAVEIEGARNTEHARQIADLIGNRLVAFRREQGDITVAGTEVKQVLVNAVDYAKSK